MAKRHTFHKDIMLAKELIYRPCRLGMMQPELDYEGWAYGAYTFQLGGSFIVHRGAKVTPKKTGQFVTLWKRSDEGPILPYNITDSIDFAIINTRNGERFGQFIFSKPVLCEKGILSTEYQKGKTAMRVYPSWDIPTAKQAQETQKWQLDYFVDMSDPQNVDVERAKLLFAKGGARFW